MFQTRANSYEGICWVLVWSYFSLRVSNKTEFLWRHLLSLSLNLCKFMSFKQKRFLVKAFAECQVEFIYVYEFQTKVDSYEGISWASFWNFLSLWVSNKSQFWWRHLLNFGLKISKLKSFKEKRILIKKFVKCQFEVT